MSDSSLIIGPLRFTHSVQKISVQENRGIEILPTTRSDRNYIVDGPDPQFKAQINFLFTGIDEVNEGVRSLLALFRTCPITSLKNEFLSALWKPSNTIVFDDGGVDEDTGAPIIIEKTVVHSDFIPITLEELVVSTVNDIPYSVSVSLIISKIDVSFLDTGGIYYQGALPGSATEDPIAAHWLSKWIRKMMSNPTILPYITKEDFDNVSLRAFARSLLGTELPGNLISKVTTPKDEISLNSEGIRTLAETCRLTNRFAYHKLIGKGVPTAQYMGCSSRLMSIDLLIDTGNYPSHFKKFCNFKEAADEAIRNVNRYDRMSGWYYNSPIAKLMGVSKYLISDLNSGVYVPVNISINTTDDPNLKTCSIDLAENDVDFINNQDGTLIQGGQELKYVRQYYLTVLMPGEQLFRRDIASNEERRLSAMSGHGDHPEDINSFEMFRIVWPSKNNVKISTPDGRVDLDSLDGILNADSLRAAFLSPKIDQGGDLRIKLKQIPLISGAVIIGAQQPSIFDRVALNLQPIREGILGRELATAQGSAQALDRLEDYIRSAFSNINDVSGEVITQMASYMLQSYAGNSAGIAAFSSSTTNFLRIVLENRLLFSTLFKEALFDAIVKRRKPEFDLSSIYSVDGLNAAFFNLSIAYINYLDSHPNFEHAKLDPIPVPQQGSEGDYINTASVRAKRSSVYQDLLLPSYIDLYGDEWQSFAPTYADLGILNPDTPVPLTVSSAQDIPAVLPTDIVEPHAWFAKKRSKPDILSAVKDGADIANVLAPVVTLSIPFNTSFIPSLKEKLEEVKKKGPNISDKTLDSLIRESLVRYKNSNPEDFNKDMKTLKSIDSNELYRQKFFSGESFLKTYITNNQNIAISTLLTVPGLGGEIFRVAKEAKLLERSDLATLNDDASYRSSGDITESTYDRHQSKNTYNAVKSSVDQIPDDKYSAARLFPAIKVYLLDRRGNDIIVNDIFFSFNGIVSVDITHDKDDADLAVIRIADPLYLLQDAKFPSGNVVRGLNYDIATDKDESKTYVTGNDTRDSVLQKYQIIQGRPIQIRMGYTSMVNNLPIVFTGKISEISPGDILTIVAQGWKSELVSRQVNFYNTDPVNFGSKDLAVMAIQQSDPDGFGDYFPQKTADELYRVIESLGDPELIKHTLSIQQDTTNTKGYVDISSKIANFLLGAAGFRGIAQSDIGLDTRLKNIWYPDTSGYNNAFGLRSKLSMLPAFSNDGWIVPLQPAWDVLKEASRHAWNCIVQVVPYDGQATIFFGHPDQPYYYTRGERSTNKKWTQLIRRLRTTENTLLNKVSDEFLRSKLYRNSENTPTIVSNLIDHLFTYRSQAISMKLNILQPIINVNHTPLENALEQYVPDFISAVNITNYAHFRTVWADGGLAGGEEKVTLEEVFNPTFGSNIFSSAYENIYKLLGDDTPFILLKLLFNIERQDIVYAWPSIQSDIHILFEPISEAKNNKLEILFSKIGGISVGSEVIREYVRKLRDILTRTRRGRWHYRDFINTLLIPIENINFRNIDPTSPIQKRIKDLTTYVKAKKNELEAAVQADRSLILSEEETSRITRTVKDLVDAIDDAIDIPSLSRDSTGKYLETRLRENITKLCLFTYFFNQFLAVNETGMKLATEVKKADFNQLPPNMKVFRVHHWVDDVSDIIQNNIVATTSEMWNTVIVEHPAKDGTDDAVSEIGDIINKGSFYSSVKWEYYPKQEVTGVIGLQFHPGMTLANKKIQVFTELNCHTPELSAKLACTHLANGLRRMYRGSLAMRGKIIKPHDRIVLLDRYTNMSGPVEVESVVHHWNAQQGWVTNIVPQAVCDANPGAAILQTAILEAAYERIYAAIDFASEAITFALAASAIGGVTTTLRSSGSVFKGLKRLPNALGLGSGTIKQNLARGWGRILARQQINLRRVGRTAGELGTLNPFKVLQAGFENFGRLAIAAGLNATASGIADSITHFAFKQHVVSGFIRTAKDVEQLPVILSPLSFNGVPFTAGLEMDDSIYGIFTNGMMYSLKDLSIGANALLDDFFDINTTEAK